jgi:hypothetical protein
MLWREQVTFQWNDDDDDLYFYSAISLKQPSAGRDVAQLWHIILIPSHQVFALTNATCLSQKQQIPIL